MTRQSLHASGRLGELTVRLLNAAPTGFVLLGRGPGLSNPVREFITRAHHVVCATIMSEGLPPGGLHATTVRWLIEHADDLSIWIADTPQFDDELDAADRAMAGGAKFVTTIEATPANAAAWIALARRWKRKTTALVFPGPENAEPVAGAADMPPPVVPTDVAAEGRQA